MTCSEYGDHESNNAIFIEAQSCAQLLTTFQLHPLSADTDTDQTLIHNSLAMPDYLYQLTMFIPS